MGELQLTNVTKSYGDIQIIKGANLHINDGEFVVFVGPSGCGKSTILRMIAGLEDITSGDIHIDGTCVNNATPAQRGIAMVFQSYALYPHLSVRKNLSFGLENLKIAKDVINEKVEKVAKMLAIEDYLDRKPKALSGGQRQRVAIGRAIVRDPKLFLFDEPLSNLDAKLRVQTRDEISRLHKTLQTTMIYVTHDQVEAMTMAERIVVLRDGHIEQFGTPLEIFNRPKNLFVAGFIGSPQMNIFDGVVTSIQAGQITIHLQDIGDITLQTQDFQVVEGQLVKLGVRPSHIHIQDDGTLHASVTRVEKMGHETFVYLTNPQSSTPTIVHIPAHMDVNEGDVLPIQINATSCHLFDAKTTLSLRVDA